MDEDKIFDKFDIEVQWDTHECNWKYKTDPESTPDEIWAAINDVNVTLTELQLRQQHDDLQEAWEKYDNLLQKYKFWNGITK